MNVTSIFDVLGPIMIGPSSSHTAGAVRLGLLARAAFGQSPKRANITLFSSFAQTGKGHGSDLGLLAGLMGISPDDANVRDAKKLARDNNLEFTFCFEPSPTEAMHPNTVCFELETDDKKQTMWGSSLGAGQVQLWKIDDAHCKLDGKSPALLIRHNDRMGLIGQVTTICGGNHKINISRFSSLRDRPGGSALMTAILDEAPTQKLLDEISKIENVTNVRSIAALEQPKPGALLTVPDDFFNDDIPAGEFAKKIIALEASTTSATTSQVETKLLQLFREMNQALEEARKSNKLSASKLVGDEHIKWQSQFNKNNESLCRGLSGNIIRDALAMAAYNAKMGRIAAAPTAGACGILPAVLINIAGEKNIANKIAIEALAIAGMTGAMIAQGASLSGAECGCQAECGSASAMAASAAAYMTNQSSKQILNAAALALKNHLGLTCDPVAGLVEVPCVKRNAFAANAAILACELSRANIQSVIPFRQIIQAMNQTGKMIPPALRESSEAGLAGTTEGQAIARELN